MDSRFIHLTTSNITPSESEACEISDLISKEESICVDLEARVAQAQAILDDLLLEYTLCSSRIAAYKATRSPLRRLPAEIVTLIFVQLCPEKIVLFRTRGARYPLSHLILPEPLLVSQICAGWRRLALGMPNLWNSLAIDFPLTNSTQLPILNLATLWFSRSGKTPLEIEFITHTTIASADVTDGAIPDFIHSYLSRFRKISLALPMEILHDTSSRIRRPFGDNLIETPQSRGTVDAWWYRRNYAGYRAKPPQCYSRFLSGN